MENIDNFYKQVETPCYVYDLDLLEDNLKQLKRSSNYYKYNIHYAIKANVNPDILKLISSYGFGADCVSGNEIKCALENGFVSEKIVFAGVGKTDKEIIFALENNIFCFNCESIEELMVINELASSLGKVAKVALRINPNIDAKTHAYITTGLGENKFGIHPSKLDEIVDFISNTESILLEGLHFHIGSQITQMEPFINLTKRVNHFLEKFDSKNISIKTINVGGGLGVDYHNPENTKIDFDTYFKVFYQGLKIKKHQNIHFELGRSIVGHCGKLVSTVLYIKQGVSKNFAILDAGMTELIRPALYQAYHSIENKTSNSKDIVIYDIVGPICESSDTFGKDIKLQKTRRKDIILIHTTGAYGEVMSSQYNCKTKVRHAIWRSNKNLIRK